MNIRGNNKLISEMGGNILLLLATGLVLIAPQHFMPGDPLHAASEEPIAQVAPPVVKPTPVISAPVPVKNLVAQVIPEPLPPEPPVPEIPPEIGLYEYVTVIDACGPYRDGDCVNMRSGPSTSSPAVTSLRNGVVLKVATTTQAEGLTWYQIDIDDQLRYPERVTGEWWVAGDYLVPMRDDGDIINFDRSTYASTSKRIEVKRSEQKLYAYEGDEIFMELVISTGIEMTPTPRGTFHIFKKTPSRYMQGPIAGLTSKYYDLPGVPWNLYFTHQGAVIHGAYWHDKFGKQYSSGCVNVPLDKARELYDWAEIGTPVIVQD